MQVKACNSLDYANSKQRQPVFLTYTRPREESVFNETYITKTYVVAQNKRLI